MKSLNTIFFKTFAIVLLTLLSAVSFAGPEDHFQNQVCYVLSAEQAKLASDNIPQEICLEEVNMDLNKYTVSIYSYFNQDLFSKLSTKSLIRNTEDTYTFQLEGVIKQDSRGTCNESLLVTLKIDGTSDFNGYTDPRSLSIEVVEDFTNDSCHIEPISTSFQYLVR